MPVRREIPSRSAAWLFVAALLALVAARPARASGCHEADRPVLGLTLPGDLPAAWADPIDADSPPAHGWQESPCPADPAGPSARPNLPAASPDLVAEVGLIPVCVTTLPPVSCDALPPLPATPRWERPPRVD